MFLLVKIDQTDPDFSIWVTSIVQGPLSPNFMAKAVQVVLSNMHSADKGDKALFQYLTCFSKNQYVQLLGLFSKFNRKWLVSTCKQGMSMSSFSTDMIQFAERYLQTASAAIFSSQKTTAFLEKN